ncbi:MAG TPA: ABC transporter permease [Patescibacteria group bacterium]|nr:ABC transporter permease [Patescibacteria group bacterium]
MHRLRALLRKEFIQMMRERRTVVMSLVVPVTLLLLFGVAVSFDIREIKLGIWDRDDSSRSREIIRAFLSSEYFREVGRIADSAGAERMLDAGEAAAVLVIPRGFGRDVHGGAPASVQVLLDGSDSSTASVVQGHVRNIVQTYTAQTMAARLREQGVKGTGDLLPIDFRPRVLYNPELKSRNFMVPGLIGVLLTMLGVLQTSLAIAKEKDRVTLDQLRVTPLRAREILVGKVLPYALVAFANAWIAVGVGRFLLDVPVRGSLWIFTLGTVLFLMSALGVGLVISAVTESQMAAQSAAFLASVLPVFYLSDYMFPLRNMPFWLRGLSYALPARFYVSVLRSTLQKGVGFEAQWGALAALAIYAAAIGSVGILAIRRALR